MDTYVDQRAYTEYQQDVLRCQRLISEVQSAQYNVLIAAANLVGSNTVSVPTSVFQDLLAIVGRLDSATYTYPYTGI